MESTNINRSQSFRISVTLQLISDIATPQAIRYYCVQRCVGTAMENDVWFYDSIRKQYNDSSRRCNLL